MTIPSLNGDSNFSSKITVKQQEPQNVEELVNTTQQEQSTTQTTKNEVEKEYSIKQFKIDYAKLVEKDVIPILLTFEEERKKRLTWAIIGAIAFVIAAVAVLFFVEGRSSGDLAGALIGGAVAVWAWIKKSFENLL